MLKRILGLLVLVYTRLKAFIFRLWRVDTGWVKLGQDYIKQDKKGNMYLVWNPCDSECWLWSVDYKKKNKPMNHNHWKYLTAEEAMAGCDRINKDK
jgi:hypothetical protein